MTCESQTRSATGNLCCSVMMELRLKIYSWYQRFVPNKLIEPPIVSNILRENKNMAHCLDAVKYIFTRPSLLLTFPAPKSLSTLISQKLHTRKVRPLIFNLLYACNIQLCPCVVNQMCADLYRCAYTDLFEAAKPGHIGHTLWYSSARIM